MKPVNIYALTRLTDNKILSKLERQMSGRTGYLKIKSWEVAGLKSLCEAMGKVHSDAPGLEFYYSFIMPKLGKEFDLIRIGDSIINIELKSGNVSEQTIRKQLLQNKYYISVLGKTSYFYTYVSGEDRLYRLTGSGRIVQAHIEELCELLANQKDCYDGDIEELFKEKEYLISPLTDPDRFLRQDYFLTFQQKDIKRHILRGIKAQEKLPAVFGFTGFPGTGKTLLLYDLAMQLSGKDKVCLFHFGSHTRELEQLDKLLKRIDFYYTDTVSEAFPNVDETDGELKYSAILVDEGHILSKKALDGILALALRWNAPVIISYDREDFISKEERHLIGSELIEAIPGFTGYKLTNKIRLNKELSDFIRCSVCLSSKTNRREFGSVSLVYAADDEEARILLDTFKNRGYEYIQSIRSGKEYPSVVMKIDAQYYYDEYGFLRYRENKDTGSARSAIVTLYHGLSRAKDSIAIIVQDNMPVFTQLLSILQYDAR